MTRMSLGEELDLLFKVCLQNKLSIVIFLLLAIVAYLFITTNRRNANVTKKTYIIAYVVIIVFVLVTFSTHITKFLDYMINNFFIAVYFPNLAIYFAAIIVSNIIAFISVFNFDINRIIRNINIVVYSIISFLFFLLIGVISDRGLDIYSQHSIYANDKAHALIELTSIIFMIWIIFLITYYAIRRYQEKKQDKEKVVKKKLPNNIIEVDSPKIALKVTEPPKLDEEEINAKVAEEVEKRVKTKLAENKALDNILSREDYVLLLKVLKEKKEEKTKEIIDDQSSLMKLDEMYKSVR